MMKKHKRVVSVLLAALLSVNGSPLSLFARAEEPLNIEPPMPETKVRFVQTGFSEDGVLTMSLQVKVDPAEDGTKQRTVSEGVFVFETDADTVIPMTHPKAGSGTEAEELLPDKKKVAVIANSKSKAVADFLTHEEGDYLYDRGIQYANSYNTSMGNLYSDMDFDEDYTGFLVAFAKDAEEKDTGKLACYFQYRFNWSVFPEPDADGYVTITNFDFQCYSGTENGNPKKATNEDALYSESVTLPETEEEAEHILHQFYTSKKSLQQDEAGQDVVVEEKIGTMAMGACGVIEKQKRETISEITGRPSTVTEECAGSFFFAEPVITPWRGEGGRAVWYEGALSLEGSPGWKYAHMTDPYVVKKFRATINNTFSTDPNTGANYDFRVPDNEIYLSVPRYEVPTVEETQEREESGNWVPTAYNTEKKRVPLKYSINTTVSDNSITSPEHEDFDIFLDDIKWEFTLDGTFNRGMPLNDLWTQGKLELDSGEGKLMTNGTGEKLRVRKATIVSSGDDDTFYFNGRKVQVVYTVVDENDAGQDVFFMVTPVGITMDFDETTEITYYDKFEEDREGGTGVTKTVRGKAPQLHITSDAGDPESYLWMPTQGNEIGQVLLQGTYDPEGGAFQVAPMEVRLYKKDPVPTSTDLVVEGSEKMTDEAGIKKDGFYAGVDINGNGNGVNDVFLNGVTVYSSLYDQYGFPMKGYQNNLEFLPTAETIIKLKNAQKDTAPFMIIPAGEDLSADASKGNAYTIKYKEGKNVNSIVPGMYFLKASYGQVRPSQQEFYVKKDPDHFRYLKTALQIGTASAAGDASEITVHLDVPALQADGSPVKKTEQIRIIELGNQWRDVSDTNARVSEFDIVPGLRSEDGVEFDLAKIRNDSRRLLAVTFEPELPEGDMPAGLDFGHISNGQFSYTTSTPKNTEFTCKITVTYQYGKNTNEVDVITQTYRFIFDREPSLLQKITLSSKDVVIPAKSAGEPKVETIVFKPYDQYDRQMTWPEVVELYKPGTSLNPGNLDYNDWGLYIDEEKTGTLPSGVSLTSEDGVHNSSLSVNYTATDCDVWIYARFGTTRSESKLFKIRREPSRVTAVTALSYGKQPICPGVLNGGKTQTILPQLEVRDQYGDVMDSGYEVLYSGVKSVDSDLITLKPNGTLIVEKCAPNCTVSVGVAVFQDGALRASYNYDAKVKREPVIVEGLSITTKELNYPASGNDRSFQLNLSATTQYGDSESLKPEEISWKLESITLQDNSLVMGVSSSGTYTADTVSVTKSGLLTFQAISEANQVPKFVTVSVQESGGTKSEGVDITIHKASSYAASIYYLDADYEAGVAVPSVGQKSNTFELLAYVKDQYGCEIPSAQVFWSPVGELPHDVTFSGKTVTVASNAEQGAVSFQASYGSLDPITVTLSIAKDPVEVTAVKVASLKKDGQVLDGMKVFLPAMTGSGDIYSLQALVEDQFGHPMSGAVRWRVVPEASNVQAEITGVSNDKLLIKYSEAARDRQGGEVTLEVSSASHPEIKSTQKIEVGLDRAAAAYAIPVLTSAEQTDPEDGRPIIPKRGDPSNVLTYSAQVYSQYGLPMEGHKAVISLLNTSTGLTFQQDKDANTGKLQVASNVSTTTIRVQAVPSGVPNGLVEESICTVTLSGGIRYVYELELDEALNQYTIDVPGWDSDKLANTPAGPTRLTPAPTYSAKVVDQYGKWMNALTDTYPVWQFVGEHPGVEFGDSVLRDTDQNAKGELISLKVTSEAVKQDKVRIKVWTSTEDPNDKNFAKTITIRLNHATPQQNYLYIEGVGEDGALEEPLGRPYAKDGVLTYRVKPVVYDQYGAPVNNALVNLSMDVENAEEQNAIVEKIYRRGESEENNNVPISYKIYRLEPVRAVEAPKTLMAEFSTETGDLKVYTACTLTEFVFLASCDSLSIGGHKRVIVPIQTERALPYSLKILRESGGDFLVRGSSEDMVEHVSAAVYNQYGEPYVGNLKFVWSLHIRDQGELKGYDTELDSEGNEKPFREDFLVQLAGSGDSARDAVITVQTEQFFESKTVVLRCEARDQRGVPFDPVVMNLSDINVRKAGGVGAGGVLSITFDAGKYGKLVGSAEVSASSGEPLTGVPGVKTETGYGFIGWTTNGIDLVDARDMYVYTDMAFTAVYKDITNTTFLNGYKDHTVKQYQQVTRAEFIKMLVSALGGYDGKVNYGSSFEDVAPGKWYTNYIAFALKQGIATGYPDGTFRPDAKISRAEAAKLIAVATKLDEVEGTSFTDVDEKAWYAGYVQALCMTGIVNGYKDDTYKPEKAIARNEAVKMIVMVTKNALTDLERDNIREFAYCPFIDVKRDDWAYAYIVRAAGIA